MKNKLFMQNFLISLIFTSFLSLQAMEIPFGKQEEEEKIVEVGFKALSKATEKKRIKIPKGYKKITCAPEALTIVPDGKVLNDKIWLNLGATESLTQFKFKKLIEAADDKNSLFILAMVIVAGGKYNARTINFYSALEFITSQALKDNKDPLSNLSIMESKFFSITSLKNQFEYLGSDYDLRLGDKEVQEFMQQYFYAVESGDAEAQNHLGYLYTEGLGVPQNYEKAVEWFTKAADQGYARAQSSLGYLYEEGLGVTKNYSKAVEWFTKAADQGYAGAQHNLGSLYEEGLGVTRDYKKAVEWYTKAAELGDADAQSSLGYLYTEGLGVTRDYEKAVEWFTKAANQGYADAQYRLGHLYTEGLGVTRDYEKAVEWITKAADQGHPNAQNNLGYLYEKGLGVPQDYKKATELYRNAAQQDDVDAQFALGYLYAKGWGVPQDYEKGVEWITKAAEQSHAGAKKTLEKLKKTEEEIKEEEL